MTTLFIADLHLSGENPHLTSLLDYFVDQLTGDAQAIYILGDLFEVWLGDDMVLPDYQPAIAAIQRLTARNIPVYVIHGNRDFLLRQHFCASTGATLLAEPAIITLNGTPTLLLHGDTLCTDDLRYQQLRQMVRDPHFQSQFLAKTPAERIAQARQYREMSKSETSNKSSDIMDVNQTTVEEIMRKYHVTQLIHGHTHRPAVHRFNLDGQPMTRYVLSDWGQRGSYLMCNDNGCELKFFTL